MLLRLVVATQDGLSVDRDDILVARLGHAGGVRIFDAAGEACNEHYENCGLEWGSRDGDLGQIVAREMLIQQNDDGILAVACIVREGDRKHGGETFLLSDDMEEAKVLSAPVEDQMLEPEPVMRRRWSFRAIFRKQRKAQKIFSVRRHLPEDFHPIS